ncbi:hypothetical protein Turpa_0068 [Turneriella parva DSM 21527]|uniref:Uncharacterized protein n=1 Tax=Turneriella parva (strain ATCC BAA-1111 / DSM 21527 / NCTC 11395 / H) TaxID=869212 RepID=I4B0C4_TURPD|nr:hypothetical protein Turpa_0068 [Turneriella parva DSM 21527]
MNVNRIVGFARRGSSKLNSKTTSHTNNIEWCSVALTAIERSARIKRSKYGPCFYAYAERRFNNEISSKQGK